MIRKFILIFTILLTANSLLISQELDYDNLPVADYSNPREYEIADISVSGVEFLQPMVLISISGLKVGQRIPIPGDEITKAIQKFWDQGLFADVKISSTKTEGGKIWLDIIPTSLPRMNTSAGWLRHLKQAVGWMIR